MATEQNFWLSRMKTLVALVIVLVTISRPGPTFQRLHVHVRLCKACSLVKCKGQNGLCCNFSGGISDCNAGFLQWHSPVETLYMYI